MSAIDDLKAADAAENVQLGLVSQALTDESARVNAALDAVTNSNDPAVAAVAADLQSHVTNLQTIATALAAVAAKPTPVPTPTPSPTPTPTPFPTTAPAPLV